MNKDKLESLRRLAADERTPVEEARNAALLFVRGGGQIDDGEIETLRARVAALEKEAEIRAAALAGSTKHVRTIGADLEKERAEVMRLKGILTRLMDARKAEILAEKVRARAEQEAREAIGFDGEGKKTPPEKLRYEIEEEFAREYAARVSEWHVPSSWVHPKK